MINSNSAKLFGHTHVPSNKVFAAVPLDRESLPQSRLDIATRVRTNLFPWTGQFSPQLVEELLAANAPRNGLVLDPFVGSGTSLVEAARLGLASCGCEISLAAVALARVYGMINLEVAERFTVLDRVFNHVFSVIGTSHDSLFRDHTKTFPESTNPKDALVKLWRASASGPEQDLLAALVILCDFYRKGLDSERVYKTWQRLARIVRTLPMSPHPVVVHHADARALPIESRSVDLVLTSPPYINVQNYHQQYRRSVEALGFDVLSSARSEIGSNRQNRSNRFRTVIQYSLDMALSLREMARVTRSGARLVLVLGRTSTVRGTSFYNGELVAEIATRCVGLSIDKRQERVFQNRYGARIVEDILHFRKTDEPAEENVVLKEARHVAAQALSESRPHAPPLQRSGIDDALTRINQVSPSIVLSPDDSLSTHTPR